MEDLGVQDTFAYKIIKQMMDHTWGGEEKLSDSDIIFIYHKFKQKGGSWKSLMDGDVRNLQILEGAIKDLLNFRSIKEALSE